MNEKVLQRDHCVNENIIPDTVNSSNTSPISITPMNQFASRFETYINRNLTVDDIESFRESCPVKVVTHGVMGFGLGGMFGLFISSVGPSNEMSGQSFLLNKQTVKTVFREMGSKTWSSAKNLGMVAALFSGIECLIETYRARHDVYNTIASGCISGAILGAKGNILISLLLLYIWIAGPKGVIYGCAGFAAFSAAIEHFFQQNS